MFEKAMELHERRLASLRQAADGGEPRLREPRRIAAQIKELKREVDELFTDEIRRRPPAGDSKVSPNSKVQAAWESRYLEVVAEADELKKATKEAQTRCSQIEKETGRLRARWEKAREIRYTDPPPKPNKRKRSFWERLARAVRAKSLRLFFDRFEIIEKEPIEHVVQIDELLNEREPDNRSLQKSLDAVRKSLREYAELRDEIRRLTVPNPPGADQNAL